jgi:hypothetical protein
MPSRTLAARLTVLLWCLLPGTAGSADAVALARAARYADLAKLGVAALPALLETYPGSDRETRSAILLALGSMNVKSPAAVAVLNADVDGEDSAFQDLHRYALQVVDPAVRSATLFEQVTGEGVVLDPELAGFMYATLQTAYDACDDRLPRARRYVAGLGDADPRTRHAAIVSLRIMTGASHAYHPWASDPSRKGPLDAWRAWLSRLERACRG